MKHRRPEPAHWWI